MHVCRPSCGDWAAGWRGRDSLVRLPLTSRGAVDSQPGNRAAMMLAGPLPLRCRSSAYRPVVRVLVDAGFGFHRGLHSDIGEDTETLGAECLGDAGDSRPAQRRLCVVAHWRPRVFRVAYRSINGVTEIPWSRIDAATVVRVMAISSFAIGAGRP